VARRDLRPEPGSGIGPLGPAIRPTFETSPSGSLSGTATGNTGSYPLGITATDADGGSTSQSFILELVRPCTTTVTKNTVVPPSKPVTVPVKSIPRCVPLIAKASPIDVGTSFAVAMSAGAHALQVTSAETLKVTRGEIINLRPVIPGTLTCTGFKGSVSFSPSLRNNAAFYPTQTLKGRASGCSVSAPSGTMKLPGIGVGECDWPCLFTVLLVAVEVGGTVASEGLAAIEMGEYSLSMMGIAEPPGGNNTGYAPGVGTFPNTHFVTGPNKLLDFILTGTTGTPASLGRSRAPTRESVRPAPS
jgi:hypothetical protein